VFEASGARWTVLPSSRGGHQDIATALYRGAFPPDSAIYRWNGARYQNTRQSSGAAAGPPL
jgi:hypothetical protein